MKKGFYLQGLLVVCFILCSVAAGAISVPVFTVSPAASYSVCAGSSVHIIVKAIDTASSSDTIKNFAWQVSTTGGSSWTTVTNGGVYTGATTDTLNITGATAALSGNEYRCIAKDSIGSDTSSAATLTVLPQPVVNIINGPSSVCLGTTITLTDTAMGGAWSSNNPDATINALTGVVTGDSVDTAVIITYKITNTCGTATTTKTIAVNPAPQPGTVTGGMPICAGTTLALGDTATGGIWSSSNPSSATVNASGVVTGIAQGIDTIKYTVSNSICSISAHAIVRVDTTVAPLAPTGPSTTCVGSFITLMDVNVLGTATWTASNGHAIVNGEGKVTGISYGLDTIHYLFTNACNSVDSFTTVHVDTLLGHGVISGPDTVCSGSWIMLSESISGGIWLSSNSSIANVDDLGNVTGVSQGSATISYYLSNGCGASVATHPVAVISAASMIAGFDSVGIGATIALHDSTLGGTWSRSNTHVSITTAGVITGVSTGIDTITYTVNNFCGTSTSSLVVYAGNPPSAGTISGGFIDSVCIGAQITLTTTATGGVWSVTNPSLAIITASGVVTGLASGYDSVVYTVHNGFGTNKAIKILYINHVPVVTVDTITSVALGTAYVLSGTPSGGTWTVSNDTVAQIVAGNQLAVLRHGRDTVFYTVTNACGTDKSDFIIHVNLVGVNTLNSNGNDFTVYPNPNNGEFSVRLVSNTNDPAVVTITNIMGQKVQQIVITPNTAFDIKLDQPSGLYFLTAENANGKYTAKINLVK